MPDRDCSDAMPRAAGTSAGLYRTRATRVTRVRVPPIHLRYPVALLDLDRTVVDRGQHAGGIASHDHVEHGRAGALDEAGAERFSEPVRILDTDAIAAHRAGDRGIIHL